MKKRHQYYPASFKTMLKLFVLMFTFFIILTSNSFSQSQFQLVIGDSSNTEEARSIIQTTDGGFIAVGETGINGDMYIVKLNSSGQLQWSRTIGGTGQDIAFSVAQTTEGGYIVAGYIAIQFFQTFFIKLTPEGIIEWTRGLNSGDPAWSVVQTTDGGYAAAISYGEGGGSTSMVIVKLNSMGILQWSKNIGGGSYARCIKQTTDRGYVVAGATGFPDVDMFVVKLDSNGSLQWAKTIGGPGDDFAYSIVQTTDGGYAVAGRTSSFGNFERMYVAKLDNSGMLQWTKVVSAGAGSDRAYSIVQTTDGGYAVAGSFSFFRGMLIVKLNPDGSHLWSRTVYGGSGHTYAYSIVQTADGGYAAAGYGGILGARGMFIVKLDNNGNTCGNTISHNISVGTGGILGSPFPTVTNISLTDTLLSPPTGTHGYVTQICVIGIQQISSEIPASYKLYQNYPNPFNPATIIKFDIPGIFSSSECSLRIYDMLGREIAVLVNQSLQPGTYQVEWDGKNYASGVYYYKLSILNSKSSVKYQETKRMILIK